MESLSVPRCLSCSISPSFLESLVGQLKYQPSAKLGSNLPSDTWESSFSLSCLLCKMEQYLHQRAINEDKRIGTESMVIIFKEKKNIKRPKIE